MPGLGLGDQLGRLSRAQSLQHHPALGDGDRLVPRDDPDPRPAVRYPLHEPLRGQVEQRRPQAGPGHGEHPRQLLLNQSLPGRHVAAKNRPPQPLYGYPPPPPPPKPPPPTPPPPPLTPPPPPPPAPKKRPPQPLYGYPPPRRPANRRPPSPPASPITPRLAPYRILLRSHVTDPKNHQQNCQQSRWVSGCCQMTDTAARGGA